VSQVEGKCLLEGIAQLPENAALVMTRAGKTGLITDVTGVDFFNRPIVTIGVKDGAAAGVAVIYPRPELFDLATSSENLDLQILKVNTMEEEKEVLREGNLLRLKYLDVSSPLPVVDRPTASLQPVPADPQWRIPPVEVKTLDRDLAQALVDRSLEVGQGREVAVIASVDEAGRVTGGGRIVAGGMGFVPSRILAGSAADITGHSLNQIYLEAIPYQAAIVHTHPGGTGIMHVGDATAGPGTWGRPIIAIGHDKDGQIRGASVILKTDRLFQLADEDERLSQQFFGAETPEEETNIRNRKLGIAQEYTDLSIPIALE
jgi:hypothetical protein